MIRWTGRSEVNYGLSNDKESEGSLQLNAQSRRSFVVLKSFLEHLILVKLLKRVKVSAAEKGLEGLEYSKKSLDNFGFDERIYWTLGLLANFPSVDKSSLLSIGPRFTSELNVAASLGFKKKGIVGLDTFSYSKRILCGDMHKLPFANESFSNILSGWTLSYSSRPSVVANEMIRVLRPGGLLMAAVQFVDSDETEVIRGVLAGAERVQHLIQFDGLFSPLERVFGIEGLAINDGPSRHTIVVYQKPKY